MKGNGAAANGLAVVDVDGHLCEPEALWDRYVERDYRPLARAALWRGVDDEGNRVTVLNGAPVRDLNRSRLDRLAIWRPGLRPEDIGALDPNAFHPPNPGGSDPEARLADMDAMGVGQAVLFPTLFSEHLPLVANPDAAAVLARAYNDWARDFASSSPERLFPVAVLPLQSPLHARRELERVARDGFRAVCLRPMFYDVPVIEPAGAGQARAGEGSVYFSVRPPRGVFLNHPHFRPLWERIARLDLVACVHPSLGIANPEPTSAGSYIERVAERLGLGHTVAEPTACLQDNGLFLVAACFQGLLEDLPRLRLALCHAGASWLPLALEKAETFLWLEIPGVFGRRTRPVSLEPAEVARAHPLVVSFDSWESSVAAMPDLFETQAAWSSRYPQHDASAPAEALATLGRHGVPDAIVERLMGQNARALFRLPSP